jgi:dihydroneopterin aldolase
MHYVFIEELRVEAFVGVGARERGQAQILRLDIEVGLRGGEAFDSDRLADTVDYAAVAELARAECRTTRFKLLERLAGHLCGVIEQHFRCSWVRIRIAKTGVVADAREVGIVFDSRG